jgi:two-component system response regulator ResD
MPERVLVVDDETIVTDVLGRYLRSAGYDVRVAGDGLQALETAHQWNPDLVVLDLMLPGIDGLEICRRLRQEGPVAIIILSAKGEEIDRVVGLELGADDYVAKPFSPRELTARVKSVLRRVRENGQRKPDSALRCGHLAIDPKGRTVTLRGHTVALTSKEFDLLYFLASHPNQAFRRDQLLSQVWDYSHNAEQSTVTVHVRRLREKIETDPMKPQFIKTLWGVGYKFENEGHEIKL